MEGKGAPGFVRTTAKIRLAPSGAGTSLAGEADATVGGILAAVGARLIEAASKKMMADFFGRLDADLTSRRSS
jgi:carbon monoxide dehydrogenase subunit G